MSRFCDWKLVPSLLHHTSIVWIFSYFRMAENPVNLVVDHLISFVVEEAKLLKGVRSQVKSIKDEMDFIHVFLRDADEKAETDKQVKMWVKQVRQVAFRMEDVLDEFRLRIAQQPRRRRGFRGWVRKTCGSLKRIKPRHIIATEMKEIKASLVEINERRERYQFKSFETDTEQAGSSSRSNITAAWHYQRDHALYLEELELIGIDKRRDELTDWFVQGEASRTVFAVVGTGGVGKTTLVRKAYQSQIVKTHFHCHAWITISQSFNIEELLVRLIKQFHETSKEPISQYMDWMERSELIDKVRHYLQEKRYVVVLDDVWSVELWNYVKLALLDNHCGSRIMVTTRSEDVASSFVNSLTHIYHLHPLPWEDAMVLFYKKAFGSNFSGQCPSELKELSNKIVKRSGGLPLAIVAMGSLLITKENTFLEWKKFHDSLSSMLGEDPNLKSIMKIISLSYHDLPYYLKSCFLYFGVLPEDHEMTFRKLTTLWIAEGFIKEKRGKTLEEVAKDYLDQLISRSLVVDYYSCSTDTRCCRVHDLMREFILSRFAEENFCEVLDNKSTTNTKGSSRRLSLQINDVGMNVMESIESSSHIRSLFIFRMDTVPNSFMHILLSRFVLLKILDLQDAPIEVFPHGIVNLFHLRYLNLSGTLIKTLPETLGKLQNLETLFMENTCVVELPLAILKLRKLRHILALQREENLPPFVSAAVKLPEGIGCLIALQTLSFIDVIECSNIITELEKLTQLQELSVEHLSRDSGAGLCTSISKMNHLHSLNVSSQGINEVLDLQFVSSPPLLLQRLFLGGHLEKLPGWIISLTNLINLTLSASRLKDDPVKGLQNLPNLRQLYLLGAYDGEELHFELESFQKLETLYLFRLERLQSVVIENGSMPILKKLHVEKCQQLKEVPRGITYLTSLESLILCDMPEDLRSRLAHDGGEDYATVMHVPLVYFGSVTQIGLSTAQRSLQVEPKHWQKCSDDSVDAESY